MLLLGLIFLLNQAYGYPTPAGLAINTEVILSNSLIRRGSDSLPVQPSGNSNSCSCPDTRNLREILWPCAATLVFATWVSVHLNVPPRGLSPFRSVAVRIGAMFTSILAPEATLHWACMEWLAARELTRKMVDKCASRQSSVNFSRSRQLPMQSLPRNGQ